MQHALLLQLFSDFDNLTKEYRKETQALRDLLERLHADTQALEALREQVIERTIQEIRERASTESKSVGKGVQQAPANHHSASVDDIISGLELRGFVARNNRPQANTISSKTVAGWIIAACVGCILTALAL